MALGVVYHTTISAIGVFVCDYCRTDTAERQTFQSPQPINPKRNNDCHKWNINNNNIVIVVVSPRRHCQRHRRIRGFNGIVLGVDGPMVNHSTVLTHGRE